MDIRNVDDRPFILDPSQIERVLDRLVPLVSEPGEEGVTRFLIGSAAERMDSSSFALFVKKLLSSEATAPGSPAG